MSERLWLTANGVVSEPPEFGTAAYEITATNKCFLCELPLDPERGGVCWNILCALFALDANKRRERMRLTPQGEVEVLPPDPVRFPALVDFAQAIRALNDYRPIFRKSGGFQGCTIRRNPGYLRDPSGRKWEYMVNAFGHWSRWRPTEKDMLAKDWQIGDK